MMSAEDFKFEKKWQDKIIGGLTLRDDDLLSISTGSARLDWALGRPFVEGSIVEIYGENSVGKTTLALEVAKNAQALGKHIFFVDLERKLREAQLNMIPGLSKEKMSIVYPDTGEETVDIMEEFVKSVPGCVVIMDSVSALLPEVEDTEDASKQLPASIARLCAKMIRKITGPAARNKCLVTYINHITSTLAMYGPKDTVKGGRAIGDRASQRIHMSRAMSDLLQDKDGNIVGQKVKCKVIKNNMNRPFLTAEVPILYGKGIYKEMDVFEMAKDLGIIDASSKGWYKIDDKNMRQDELLQALADNEYRNNIVGRIKELYQ
jgi:recombination protein RecA